MECFYNICVLLFLVFNISRTTVHSFNIDDSNPIVKRGEKNSYFGFSVAEHLEKSFSNLQTNWILVGAPLGRNLQPGTNHSGALFKCPVTSTQEDCVQVKTDGHRSSLDYEEDFGDFELKPPGHNEIKDGQWLGVSLKSQKPGGKIMVCAHRYIKSANLNTQHNGYGLCYLLTNEFQFDSSLEPCSGKPIEKLHEQYGLCQVGTSLSIVNGSALMGAPGPYTWRGVLFSKEIDGEFILRDNVMYESPSIALGEALNKHSYLGMSVTGGNFLNKNELTYVAGAPRSSLHGEIFFFGKDKKNGLVYKFKIKGEQFGSSFGYETLTVDINNDGFDDLLVGAPFYFDDSNSDNLIGGSVYVFTNLRNCTIDECKWDQVLRGKFESRFGFSFTNLGDINKDTYNDVAIGAPYEGDGAVYIYLGTKDGLSEQPSQIIRQESVKAFGYSLSGGLDMDENGYPDLVVGAFESDMVLLYKTRPIIDIHITIDESDMKNLNASKKGCVADPNNVNNTCFSFKSCFKIIRDKQGSQLKKFKVIYEVTEVAQKVNRTTFKDPLHVDIHKSSKTEYITIDNIDHEYCQTEIVYIDEGVRDILTPINYTVSYKLAQNYKIIDDSLFPILNKTSIKNFEATFQKSCGDDGICESNLNLDAGISPENSADGKTILGDNKQLILYANINNYGESAYEAKLFVIHSETLGYVSHTPKSVLCTSKNRTLVTCDLGNPMASKREAKIQLKFEIDRSSREKILKLHMFVNTTSTDISDRRSATFDAILQKLADYTITGKSLTPHIFYGGEIKGQSAMQYLEHIGSRVRHKYQVANNGLWNLENVEITIAWPYQVNSDREQGKWLLYLESEPTIEVDIPSAECTVEPKNAVNPLHLTSTGVPDILQIPENFTAPYPYVNTNHIRRKRDTEYVVEPKKIMGPDGKERWVILMDCYSKTTKCAIIRCSIPKLMKGAQAIIDINSRLWNSTLVEDYYKNVDWVSIKSFANVTIGDDTVTISEKSIGTSLAETVAYPELISADSQLNLWIIVGAVLAGLIVLVILTFILYKCGFFKRNRPNNLQTGNLQKKGEAENLLKMSDINKT